MVKINKKTISHTKILIIIIIIILFVFLIYNINSNNNNNKNNNKLFIENFNTNNFEANIEKVKNPYIKFDHQDVIWQKLDSEFMKKNWPNTFDFDYDIKEDIIKHALTLPKNYCIIDCGAHIGDGSVSIAHALKINNREDIIVYAIDPSNFKCNFIEFIKKKNNLNNLVVLNYGLSNVNNTYKSKMNDDNNTGAWEWVLDNTDSNTDSNTDNNTNNVNIFIKLDDLVKENIIKHSIGIIHFDVEGMEKEAILGGFKTIEKNKPYMSIENNMKSGKNNNGIENSTNTDYYLEFLPKGYKYSYNKKENNILMYNL
jgi:FkbM family methyltransferase